MSSSFRLALLRQHPSLTEVGSRKAQDFNFQRYYFQGIGRYAPDAAYARGLADLKPSKPFREVYRGEGTGCWKMLEDAERMLKG
jgi:hypothetical protein